MDIEMHNLAEEIKEGIQKALDKGIINNNCSVYRVMREEQFSPKGKIQLIKNNFLESHLNSCNLCKGCEFSDIPLCTTFHKVRQILILKGKESNRAKIMVENMQSSGNIYGIMKPLH